MVTVTLTDEQARALADHPARLQPRDEGTFWLNEVAAATDVLWEAINAQSGYEGMTCQDCGLPFSVVLDFLVADAIWNFVMADQTETTLTIRPGFHDGRLQARSEGVGGVVCLSCFDTRAKAKNIEYRQHVVVFGRECWQGGFYEDGIPT